ncbi:MAG: hypothetical protein KAX38_01270, partial [Candidatus Krumholzibacteria bacterium]|nr:hypothetical protein [Candidatus Krumholzibacteria bacterium]
MYADREQKIFLTILWIFLIGSLVFFKSFLSLDCIILPAPLWFTFLLLNVGFIFFIFLPRPKGVFPGQHVRDRWYPRTLADIVESGQEEVGEESIRPSVKAVSPVPLIPLVLLLALVILAAPVRQSEEEWRKDESERLQRVYREAEGEVAEMEALVRDLGTRTVKIIGGGNLGSMSSEDRAGLIHRIDSLAGSVRVGLTPFHEVGIQVYSTRRKRVAWGGSPRHIRTAPGNFTRARVFTSRTQLYTLLVRYEPLPGGGLIVIDIPLEVNYRINNNYLRNVSLGEILSERYGEEIEFNFSMGEHRGEVHWDDESLKKTGSRVLYNPDLGIQAYGIVLSEAGLPLARLRVLGDPFSAVVSEREARRIFWAGIDVVLIVVILALWIYSTYGKKRSRVRGRFWNFFKRSAVFIIFLAIIRYLLLGLDIPNCILSTNLFDPALFADDVPGGLMRTTGDFLLTTLFALILVFGSIKTFRTYYTGHLEKRLTLESPFRWPVFVAKALVLFGVLAGCMWLAGNIVSRVVLNSNPRLIGLDVAFFELPVLMLHLALLFAVSAIFIACLFVCRLVLVSSGGSLRAGLLASAAALALYILLFHVHWGLFWAAAGLLVLSASIFPLIKKEEGISIIFSSFLLVLICSLVIYSVAFERYTELRMSRVLEKAQDFNHPEDNWLHVVLLDMCQEISSDVSIASRALLREESAAFEFWAESMLSLFNLSCVFDVYDSRGKCFSSFAVGMPFDPSHDPGGTAERCVEPFVESIEQETRRGAVFYYRSVSPLFHAYGNITGRVEITIPYFFEDPELLARTGPMAPEILHNVERGSLAPRIDEPENLLVARLSQNRVVDSSDPNLVAGTRLPGGVSEWFDLDLGSERYNCIVKLREKGEGFLVGYRTAGKSEGLLLWATVVSLDAMLTVISLLILVLARRIPLLRNMTPDIALAGGLGFRQKILLSFLVV